MAAICTAGILLYYHLSGPPDALPLIEIAPSVQSQSTASKTGWAQSRLSTERPYAPTTNLPYGSSRSWQDIIPSPCDTRMLSRQSPETRRLCAQPPSLDAPAGQTSFNDLIPTYTSDGQFKTNRAAWDVHTSGLLHKASQVLLFDDSGKRLLLGERTHKKWIWPGGRRGQVTAGPDPALVALAPEGIEPAEITTNSQGFTSSVEVYSTDGVVGYTTYRLAVSIPKHEKSLYSIYGHKAGPLIIPGAWQHTMGVSKGGPKLGLFEFIPEIEFDSYLTCGVTDDSANLGAGTIPLWKSLGQPSHHRNQRKGNDVFGAVVHALVRVPCRCGPRDGQRAKEMDRGRRNRGRERRRVLDESQRGTRCSRLIGPNSSGPVDVSVRDKPHGPDPDARQIRHRRRRLECRCQLSHRPSTTSRST